MRLIPFEPGRHGADCLALFDGHVGGLFSADERPAFQAFLDALPGPYLVGMDSQDVVACGGIAYEDETHRLASVCWTIVRSDHQGRGLGRTLTHACLDLAAADPRCEAVRLETVPATSGFFAKLGFHVVETQTDGYGPGVDRVEMRRELSG